MSEKPQFVPALGYQWLTGLYDTVIRWTMPEQRLRQVLADQAVGKGDLKILDFGCGTGSLTFLIASRSSLLEVEGVDVDPAALAIAGDKVRGAPSGVRVRFRQVQSGRLPFPDHSFDRVVSSLVFHHLQPTQKQDALRECFRVLRPGGEIHIADWGKPAAPLLRLGFLLIQILDGFATTRESVQGRLPYLVAEAGFSSLEETQHIPTVFGSLRLLKARRE
jgi:ubiquinone/menaquinone biosynthesis C-methylase UbiE